MMSSELLVIQRVTLTRRDPSKLGALKACQRVKERFGLDLLGEVASDDLTQLLMTDGGALALLGVLFRGDLASIDEDELDIDQLLQEVGRFFALPGKPSSEPGDGCQSETAPSA